jgi:hypothetical protein
LNPFFNKAFARLCILTKRVKLLNYKQTKISAKCRTKNLKVPKRLHHAFHYTRLPIPFSSYTYFDFWTFNLTILILFPSEIYFIIGHCHEILWGFSLSSAKVPILLDSSFMCSMVVWYPYLALTKFCTTANCQSYRYSAPISMNVPALKTKLLVCRKPSPLIRTKYFRH